MEFNVSVNVTHRGGCHCGAVAFEVDAPAQPTVVACNCSICSKTGFMHLIVPKSKFRLLRGETWLTEYRFGTDVAKHLFCRKCGVKSFYIPKSNPDGYSVNVRCIDQATLHSVNVMPFDDGDREASEAKVRHMSQEQG